MIPAAFLKLLLGILHKHKFKVLKILLFSPINLEVLYSLPIMKIVIPKIIIIVNKLLILCLLNIIKVNRKAVSNLWFHNKIRLLQVDIMSILPLIVPNLYPLG